MRKIAITLPEEHVRTVDRIARRRQWSRSRVIQHAVAYFLSEQSLFAAVREYEEGYRRKPEDAAEIESYAAAAAEVLGHEDWT